MQCKVNVLAAQGALRGKLNYSFWQAGPVCLGLKMPVKKQNCVDRFFSLQSPKGGLTLLSGVTPLNLSRTDVTSTTRVLSGNSCQSCGDFLSKIIHACQLSFKEENKR